MNLLPIGSVIRSNGIDLVITGHHLNPEERSHKMYYIVSFFPIGYMPAQVKSQAFLPADKEYEVLFTGYLDELGKKHMDRLNDTAETLRDMDPRVMTNVLTEAAKRLEEKSK